MFAIPALDRGGPDRVMFELLCALDRERFEPSLLVSSATGEYLSKLPSDVRVIVLGDKQRFMDRYPVLRALRAVRQLEPDVVFATLRMQLTLGAVRWAFPRKVRFIVRPAVPHSTDFATLVKRAPIKHRVARGVAAAILREADATICQREQIRADLVRLLGSDRGLHLVGNPIDTEAVHARTKNTNATVPGDPALVSVGRLWPQKGFDILLPALAIVREKYPRLHLTVYGEGPDRAALEQQARELGLSDHVTLAGFSADPLPAVRAASAFVLSSRYEGFPNAVLEALACGTPVAITDCPGANREIVRPGINGRLAPSLEPGDVARALEQVLGELDSYQRSTIIDDIGARYGTRRIVSAYEQVFSSVVERA